MQHPRHAVPRDDLDADQYGRAPGQALQIRHPPPQQEVADQHAEGVDADGHMHHDPEVRLRRVGRQQEAETCVHEHFRRLGAHVRPTGVVVAEDREPRDDRAVVAGAGMQCQQGAYGLRAPRVHGQGLCPQERLTKLRHIGEEGLAVARGKKFTSRIQLVALLAVDLDHLLPQCVRRLVIGHQTPTPSRAQKRVPSREPPGHPAAPTHLMVDTSRERRPRNVSVRSVRLGDDVVDPHSYGIRIAVPRASVGRSQSRCGEGPGGIPCRASVTVTRRPARPTTG